MSVDFQTTHLPRGSYSDPHIYAEQVCRIRITKDRRERDGLLCILTDRHAFLGYNVL